MKTCPRCGVKEEDGAIFPREKEHQCRECIYKREAEYKRAHPEVFKAMNKRRSQNGRGKIRYASMTSEEKELKKESQRLRYDKKKADGECKDCPKKAVLGKCKCEKHLKKTSKAICGRASERVEKGSCGACGGKPLATKTLCKECRDKRNKKSVQKRKDDIDCVLNHYGRMCACCGETEPVFLTIDHKDNDGSQHRKETGRNTYMVLVREFGKTGIWPENFQILCYNCNISRWRNGGECAHKTQLPSSGEVLPNAV